MVTTFLSGRVDEDDNAFRSEPLAPLLGVRVDEWDAREAGYVNPVTMDGATFESRLLFELVIPESAEVVGAYRSDF